MTTPDGLAAPAATDPYASPLAAPARPPSRPGSWVRLLGWPGAAPDEQQRAAAARDRRPPGLELLLVLGVFPAGAALAAVASLVTDTVGGDDHGGYLPVELPGHAVLSALLDVPFAALPLVGALLVAYLLTVSGGGLAALGLDRRRVRADLAVTGKLWLLAYLVPFALGLTLLAALGVRGGSPAEPPDAVYLLPLALGSVVAGVVEEVVVLGYLVYRLEQRGWASGRVLLLAAAVRVSYHVYYGLYVLPFVGWAVVSVVLYRRRRRLLAFVVLHALWDVSSFASAYVPGGIRAVPYLLLGSVLTVLWATRPRTGAGASQAPPPPSA